VEKNGSRTPEQAQEKVAIQKSDCSRLPSCGKPKAAAPTQREKKEQ